MIQRIFRWFSLCVIAWVFASGPVFGSPAPEQGTNVRLLTVHLQGVFSAKVSLIPFNGLKAVYSNPVAEVPDVKNGQTATIKIPVQYLPGEFVLRIDYRAKETDSPYPAERNIYINKQDIELSVNPPYINNNERTKFSAGERENTVYSVFIKENSTKRAQIDLLKQFLLSYDRPKSKFYTQGVKEFEQRRLEYNTWLSNQTKTYRELYVSSLFQFQYVPAAAWSGSENERLNQLLKHYFDGIDFSDPLIIRSRELSKFMDGYIRLYAMQATTEELRDALFTQAGRVACEKASKGHPKVYGWMVDYFYVGYETYDIKKGMAILQQHINNPNCLTSKKQQITKRLEGMAKLVPGALSPDFVSSDNEGNNFQFHKWKGKAQYKLLLFWSTGCENCQQLINELAQWYDEPVNKEKLDIITVSLDETETEVQKWEAAIVTLPEWKHLHVKGGVNSSIANDYAILSTPVMFLIGSESNIIVSVPGNLDELIKDSERYVDTILITESGRLRTRQYENEA